MASCLHRSQWRTIPVEGLSTGLELGSLLHLRLFSRERSGLAKLFFSSHEVLQWLPIVPWIKHGGRTVTPPLCPLRPVLFSPRLRVDPEVDGVANVRRAIWKRPMTHNVVGDHDVPFGEEWRQSARAAPYRDFKTSALARGRDYQACRGYERADPKVDAH